MAATGHSGVGAFAGLQCGGDASAAAPDGSRSVASRWYPETYFTRNSQLRDNAGVIQPNSAHRANPRAILEPRQCPPNRAPRFDFGLIMERG